MIFSVWINAHESGAVQPVSQTDSFSTGRVFGSSALVVNLLLHVLAVRGVDRALHKRNRSIGVGA